MLGHAHLHLDLSGHDSASDFFSIKANVAFTRQMDLLRDAGKLDDKVRMLCWQMLFVAPVFAVIIFPDLIATAPLQMPGCAPFELIPVAVLALAFLGAHGFGLFLYAKILRERAQASARP